MNKKLLSILLAMIVTMSSFASVSALYKPDENTSKTGYYNIYYVYDYEVYGVVTDDEDNPPPSKKQMVWSGDEVSLSMPGLLKEGSLFSGWREISTGDVYRGNVKFIMPTNDVYFEPFFNKFYTVTYLPGEVEGLTASAPFQTVYIDGTSFETAASSRFARTGYRLIGWTYDYNGEFYPIDAKVIMPTSNVTFTAVWEPSKYDIKFGLGGGKGSVVTIKKVEYNSTIRFPLCPYTNAGNVFTGWKYKDVIYKPGDDFTVPAVSSGITAININAQWAEGEPVAPVNSTNLAIKKFEMLHGNATAAEVQEVKDFVTKSWDSYFVTTVPDEGSDITSDGEIASDGEVA
jgi:hypothetical protein